MTAMPPFSPLLKTFTALVIAAQLALAAWYWLGRPVTVAEPALSHPVNCLSYTPFRADESPFDEGVEQRFTDARLEEDLRLLADHTSCIRLYAAGGMETDATVRVERGTRAGVDGPGLLHERAAAARDLPRARDLRARAGRRRCWLLVESPGSVTSGQWRGSRGRR